MTDGATFSRNRPAEVEPFVVRSLKEIKEWLNKDLQKSHFRGQFENI